MVHMTCRIRILVLLVFPRYPMESLKGHTKAAPSLDPFTSLQGIYGKSIKTYMATNTQYAQNFKKL